MRLWLSQRTDGTDWPRDPQLDVFREAVWELSLDGELVGWLTTSISPMRATPALWRKLEGMWTQVHWLDDRSGYLEEDYGPKWYSVEELRGGYFVTAHPQTGLDTRFDAALVTGTERDRLWADLNHGA